MSDEEQSKRSLPTQEEVFKAAAVIFGRELSRTLMMDPREAAEGAYLPGGPSVDELEVRILAMREKYR